MTTLHKLIPISVAFYFQRVRTAAKLNIGKGAGRDVEKNTGLADPVPQKYQNDYVAYYHIVLYSHHVYSNVHRRLCAVHSFPHLRRGAARMVLI